MSFSDSDESNFVLSVTIVGVNGICVSPTKPPETSVPGESPVSISSRKSAILTKSPGGDDKEIPSEIPRVEVKISVRNGPSSVSGYSRPISATTSEAEIMKIAGVCCEEVSSGVEIEGKKERDKDVYSIAHTALWDQPSEVGRAFAFINSLPDNSDDKKIAIARAECMKQALVKEEKSMKVVDAVAKSWNNHDGLLKETSEKTSEIKLALKSQKIENLDANSSISVTPYHTVVLDFLVNLVRGAESFTIGDGHLSVDPMFKASVLDLFLEENDIFAGTNMNDRALTAVYDQNGTFRGRRFSSCEQSIYGIQKDATLRIMVSVLTAGNKDDLLSVVCEPGTEISQKETVGFQMNSNPQLAEPRNDTRGFLKNAGSTGGLGKQPDSELQQNPDDSITTDEKKSAEKDLVFGDNDNLFEDTSPGQPKTNIFHNDVVGIQSDLNPQMAAPKTDTKENIGQGKIIAPIEPRQNNEGYVETKKVVVVTEKFIRNDEQDSWLEAFCNGLCCAPRKKYETTDCLDPSVKFDNIEADNHNIAEERTSALYSDGMIAAHNVVDDSSTSSTNVVKLQGKKEVSFQSFIDYNEGQRIVEDNTRGNEGEPKANGSHINQHWEEPMEKKEVCEVDSENRNNIPKEELSSTSELKWQTIKCLHNTSNLPIATTPVESYAVENVSVPNYSLDNNSITSESVEKNSIASSSFRKQLQGQLISKQGQIEFKDKTSDEKNSALSGIPEPQCENIIINPQDYPGTDLHKELLSNSTCLSSFSQNFYLQAFDKKKPAIMPLMYSPVVKNRNKNSMRMNSTLTNSTSLGQPRPLTPPPSAFNNSLKSQTLSLSTRNSSLLAWSEETQSMLSELTGRVSKHRTKTQTSIPPQNVDNLPFQRPWQEHGFVEDDFVENLGDDGSESVKSFLMETPPIVLAVSSITHTTMDDVSLRSGHRSIYSMRSKKGTTGASVHSVPNIQNSFRFQKETPESSSQSRRTINMQQEPGNLLCIREAQTELSSQQNSVDDHFADVSGHEKTKMSHHNEQHLETNLKFHQPWQEHGSVVDDFIEDSRDELHFSDNNNLMESVPFLHTVSSITNYSSTMDEASLYSPRITRRKQRPYKNLATFPENLATFPARRGISHQAGMPSGINTGISISDVTYTTQQNTSSNKSSDKPNSSTSPTVEPSSDSSYSRHDQAISNNLVNQEYHGSYDSLSYLCHHTNLQKMKNSGGSVASSTNFEISKISANSKIYQSSSNSVRASPTPFSPNDWQFLRQCSQEMGQTSSNPFLCNSVNADESKEVDLQEKNVEILEGEMYNKKPMTSDKSITDESHRAIHMEEQQLVTWQLTIRKKFENNSMTIAEDKALSALHSDGCYFHRHNDHSSATCPVLTSLRNASLNFN